MISLLMLYPGLSAVRLVGTDLVQAVPLVLAAAVSNIALHGIDDGVAPGLLSALRERGFDTRVTTHADDLLQFLENAIPGALLLDARKLRVYGRVRAMLDDKGRQLKEAPPSLPVEILGLSGVPSAGENFIAVENEARAREVSEFRQRKLREKASAAAGAGRGNLTDMLARIQAGEQKEVAVVVKADVQGSAEAIGVTLGKLGNDEVKVRVLHSAVGQITESDIQLAKASDAVIVAFNVRATSQARDLAAKEGVDIRYYSIIYEVADDIEKLYKGKLAPVQREKFLGYAQILQVFDVKKIGKVAGCRITEGVVKRGAGVRLLRDGVVIHQGELSTLKRFKDDVREVGNGLECGMSFANYDDIRVSDQIECYEVETVAAA